MTCPHCRQPQRRRCSELHDKLLAFEVRQQQLIRDLADARMEAQRQHLVATFADRGNARLVEENARLLQLCEKTRTANAGELSRSDVALAKFCKLWTRARRQAFVWACTAGMLFAFAAILAFLLWGPALL
jgi:hypothetical protein